jgi:hypothetical protein
MQPTADWRPLVDSGPQFYLHLSDDSLYQPLKKRVKNKRTAGVIVDTSQPFRPLRENRHARRKRIKRKRKRSAFERSFFKLRRDCELR